MKNEMRRLKKNRSSSDLVDYANASNVWRHQVPLGASAISSATRLIVLKPNSASKWIMPAKTRSSLKHDPWCLWHVSGWRRILASKETRGLADREVGRSQLFPICSNATLYFPILRALLSLIELSPLFLGWALLGGFGRPQTDCFIVHYVANLPPNHCVQTCATCNQTMQTFSTVSKWEKLALVNRQQRLVLLLQNSAQAPSYRFHAP